MENLSCSSYPDSRESSPRSREIDDNQSWDEAPSSTNYKVKFMCSYGGKIQPRSHDNQLAYIGGDTKILGVERNIKFSVIMNKLTSLFGADDFCLKYQLPGEDLDALISVTNDEDLEHMMLEYDRLHRASVKPARLRLFLFRLSPMSFPSDVVKLEGQWFVEALNSVQVASLEGSTPPVAAAGNPDFLFGLEKANPAVPLTKFTDTAAAPPMMAEVVGKYVSAGSEDPHVIGDPVVNQQIQGLQRLQISASHEQVILNRKIDDTRGYAGECCQQNITDKFAPGPAPVSVQMQMPIPGTYCPERHIPCTAYPVAPSGTEQPVYIIPTAAAAGVYLPQASRQVATQVGQNYHGMQRVVQEVYREQPVYSAVPPPTVASLPQQHPGMVGAYAEGIGMFQPKVAGQGYVQVGYDSAGRQVYYTTPYQAVTASPVTPVESRQGGGGGVLSQDGVVAGNAKVPQTSSQ